MLINYKGQAAGGGLYTVSSGRTDDNMEVISNSRRREGLEVLIVVLKSQKPDLPLWLHLRRRTGIRGAAPAPPSQGGWHRQHPCPGSLGSEHPRARPAVVARAGTLSHGTGVAPCQALGGSTRSAPVPCFLGW